MTIRRTIAIGFLLALASCDAHADTPLFGAWQGSQPGADPQARISIDLVLEGAIDRIILERCIEHLPAGFRKVFVLHDIRGYRHREIANLLGRSVGASKSQLHKARKRLRESLQELLRDKAREERLATASVSTESAFT